MSGIQTESQSYLDSKDKVLKRCMKEVVFCPAMYALRHQLTDIILWLHVCLNDYFINQRDSVESSLI